MNQVPIPNFKKAIILKMTEKKKPLTPRQLVKYMRKNNISFKQLKITNKREVTQ